MNTHVWFIVVTLAGPIAILYRNPYNLWFSRGGGGPDPPPPPPLDPHLPLVIKKNIFLFLNSTYIVDTKKNRLNEMVLLSTQNIC